MFRILTGTLILLLCGSTWARDKTDIIWLANGDRLTGEIIQLEHGNNVSFNMTRFRSNRWFNTYLLGFESNDELGLDLRTSIGAGAGRYLIQTNTSELDIKLRWELIKDLFWNLSYYGVVTSIGYSF